jgi:rhodanese-related sulfurtransferase
MLNRIILFIGCILMLGCNSQQIEGINKITVNELKELISKDDIQLIDVRTPKEFSTGHINKARNINYFADNFKSIAKDLDKDKAVYVYCRSGKRSSKSAKILQELGFTQIFDLQGGYLEWERVNK